MLRPQIRNAFAPRAVSAFQAGPTGGLQVRAEASEILMYGPIGDYWGDGSGIAADRVVGALAAMASNPVTVRINSPGGDVFEGYAIRNALAQHAPGVTVIVDSIAASAASFIAIAGQKMRMHDMSVFMIHRASTVAWGHDTDMLATAELLAKIDGMLLADYVRKTGGDAAALKAAIDKETYYTAAEALEAGFCDEVIAATAKPEPAKPDAAARARAQARLRLAGLEGVL
jgi:ATP-dependent protease ClpP protease subunit